MANKRVREGKETRKAIIDATINLFSQSGYAKTSVAQIARAVGCSTATIFWHFKNKEGLLYAIIEHMISEWRDDIGQRQDDPDRLEGILDIVHADDLEYFVENADFLKMIIILGVEAVGTNEKLAGAFRGLFRGYRGLVASRIRTIKKNDAKTDDAKTGESMREADIFLSVLAGALVLKLLDPETVDLPETLDKAAALFTK